MLLVSSRDMSSLGLDARAKTRLTEPSHRGRHSRGRTDMGADSREGVRLRSTKMHGTVCFAGMLSNEWIVKDFYRIAYLPTGVRLTAYGAESSNLPAAVLQRYVDRVASGHVRLGPVQTYSLDQIQEAHDDMEKNRALGKQVVVL